jgi:hypothetical protein
MNELFCKRFEELSQPSSFRIRGECQILEKKEHHPSFRKSFSNKELPKLFYFRGQRPRNVLLILRPSKFTLCVLCIPFRIKIKKILRKIIVLDIANKILNKII